MLLQRWEFKLEGATMHLPSCLAREAYDLWAAKGILALKVAFLSISMIDIIHVVLLEGSDINSGVFGELLPPPSHGLIIGEATILEKGPELEPASMFQVLLRISLCFNEPSHARWEGSHQELLEVVQRKLFTRRIGS